MKIAQAARYLDVHENVLRKWIRDVAADPAHASPGHGQMKPEQREIERLCREDTKLTGERGIRHDARLRLCFLVLMRDIKGEHRKDDLSVGIIALTEDIAETGFLLYLRSRFEARMVRRSFLNFL